MSQQSQPSSSKSPRKSFGSGFWLLLIVVAVAAVGYAIHESNKAASSIANDFPEPKTLSSNPISDLPKQPPDGNSTSDKEDLQGAWRVSSIQFGEKKKLEDELKDFCVLFENEYFALSAQAIAISSISLDQTKEPRAMDMVEQYPLHVAEQKTTFAIYELKGDNLKVCVGEKSRPTAFEAGADQVLFILKRDKTDQAKAKIAKIQRLIAASRDHIAKQKAAADFEASPTGKSQDNLKHIAMVFHAYESGFQHLPPPAIYSSDGKPLLSWRVLILPYLGEEKLFARSKMDEPWDSAHNIELVKEMPQIFGAGPPEIRARGETYYQVFVGPGTLFDGTKGVRFSEVTDGLSNTLLLAEAARAVPWSKPEDLSYDPNKPLPGLGGVIQDRINVVMGNGLVESFKQGFDEQVMRRAITRADGQPVDFNKLKP